MFLQLHGGVPLPEVGTENVDAVKKGFANLQKHIENVRKFGVPALVGLNQFTSDTQAEIDAVLSACRDMGAPVSLSNIWGKGGEGALELSDMVLDTLNEGKANFKPLYPLELGIKEKVQTVAREIYGADGVQFSPKAEKDIARLESIGLKEVPVCIAKTQYSFTDDPNKRGRPTGFNIHVREVTPSAGAGFVVVHTGDIMTMPGLPKAPAAESIRVLPDGTIEGLV